MRVLQIYKDYPPVLGGIEKHIRDLAIGLPGHGFQISVVACSTDHRARVMHDGPAKVLLLPRDLQVSSAPISLAMFFVLRRFEADLLHVHLPYPPGELAAILSGRPMVCTYHSPVVRQRVMGRLVAPFTRLILKRAKKIVVSNPMMASRLASIHLAEGKIRLIPFGVDLHRFRPAERKGEWAGVRLLFVGRFRYYKGLPTLLQAVHKVPDVNLTLAGDGRMRPELEALVEALGLQPRVSFRGDIPESQLPDLYRGHDIFVLPSDRPSETFGIAMLEAMASGLPCISTELGTGTSWLNQNGRTGLVVPPGDAGALAAAILYLAEHSDLRTRMGQAARERAEGFSLETMLQAVAHLYREAAG